MIARACAIAALLTASACDDMPQARTESEITDIATDVATDATSEQFSALEARLDDLETKASELESENEGLEQTISAQNSAIDELSTRVDDVESETESIRIKVGY